MLVLKTKDGNKIGNAIIFGGGLREGTTPVYFVETDFGNKCIFVWKDILEWFEIGGVMPYEVWDAQRRARQNAHFVIPDNILLPEKDS